MTKLSDLTTSWAISYDDSCPKFCRDKSQYGQIEGRYGVIYVWEGKTLAVSVKEADIDPVSKNEKPNRIVARIARISGLQGRGWHVFLFDTSLLDKVAKVIRARKRRKLSVEHVKKLHKKTKSTDMSEAA